MNWTGLAARTWDLLGGDEPGADYAFIRERVSGAGGLALDVGCGTGRILLRLLAEGYRVDGVDSSSDMLAVCREKAMRQGLEARLFSQPMQMLDLSDRYVTLYVAGGTFGLLVDMADAQSAVGRFHAHLQPAGVLVLTLFSPYGPYKALSGFVPNGWQPLARASLPDGGEVVHDFRRLAAKPDDHLLQELKRYRVTQANELVAEETLVMTERWYEPNEMLQLLEQSGFRDVRVTGDFTAQPLTQAHRVMVFTARR